MMIENDLNGIAVTHNNKKLILASYSVMKENVFLSSVDRINFLLAMLKNLPEVEIDSISMNHFIPIRTDGNSTSNKLVFRKFISRDTYENYVNHGDFQLGSLKKYREIERKESRDKLEGYTHIILNTESRQISVLAISAFDQYILCGTDSDENTEYMSNHFGEVMIEVKNIDSFANKIKALIGAKSWAINKVQYTNLKQITLENQVLDWDFSDCFHPSFLERIYEPSFFPSVFSKLRSFSKENEVRLAFEMEGEVDWDLTISDKSLLDDVEITILK